MAVTSPNSQALYSRSVTDKTQRNGTGRIFIFSTCSTVGVTPFYPRSMSRILARLEQRETI